MEPKSYKELQALAKLHGIRANLSKAALIKKLADIHHEDAQDNSSSSQGNADILHADSDNLRDEADTHANGSDAPEGNVDAPRLDDSARPQDDTAVPCSATADAARNSDDNGWDDTDAALPGPVEPEALLESSERRKSDRLSAATKESPAPLDPVGPEVPVESSERRKSDRLSAPKKAEKVRIKSTEGGGRES